VTYRPDEIARKVFITTLRGYDPVEVRQFLRWISEDYEDALDEAAEAAADSSAPVKARPRHAIVEATDPHPVVLTPLPAAVPLLLCPDGGRLTARPVAGARPRATGRVSASAASAQPDARIEELATLLAATARQLAAAQAVLDELTGPASG
jgi:DivIVA domain-containing protein